MPSLKLDHRIEAAIKSGRYGDYKSIARKFSVTVQCVTAIAKHGPDCKTKFANEPVLVRARRELLTRPNAKIVAKQFGGDMERYRQCVIANFGEQE